MSKIANEEYWHDDIESLKIFNDEDFKLKDKAWGLLERLQQNRSIRAVDILVIAQLLEIAMSYQGE